CQLVPIDIKSLAAFQSMKAKIFSFTSVPDQIPTLLQSGTLHITGAINYNVGKKWISLIPLLIAVRTRKIDLTSNKNIEFNATLVFVNEKMYSH
ncbi:hypothetical protein ACJX0J_027412, partial [Zea mays]